MKIISKTLALLSLLLTVVKFDQAKGMPAALERRQGIDVCIPWTATSKMTLATEHVDFTAGTNTVGTPYQQWSSHYTESGRRVVDLDVKVYKDGGLTMGTTAPPNHALRATKHLVLEIKLTNPDGNDHIWQIDPTKEDHCYLPRANMLYGNVAEVKIYKSTS